MFNVVQRCNAVVAQKMFKGKWYERCSMMCCWGWWPPPRHCLSLGELKARKQQKVEQDVDHQDVDPGAETRYCTVLDLFSKWLEGDSWGLSSGWINWLLRRVGWRGLEVLIKELVEWMRPWKRGPADKKKGKREKEKSKHEKKSQLKSEYPVM